MIESEIASDIDDGRFTSPYTLTVRQAVGDPDLALVVEDHREGSRGRIWRAGSEPAELLPFPVSVVAAPTLGGRWVIDLDDGVARRSEPSSRRPWTVTSST